MSNRGQITEAERKNARIGLSGLAALATAFGGLGTPYSVDPMGCYGSGGGRRKINPAGSKLARRAREGTLGINRRGW